MSDQPLSASTHGTDRVGSLVLVLLFAALLGGAAAAYALLPRGAAANLVTGLLAAFAVAGVFAVFAFAAGLFQFAGEPAKDDLPKRICDGDPQAMIATDAAGDFLYANDAYFRLSGARTPAGLRGVERLFAGAPGASEAVYRLAQAAREGRPAVEELCLSPAPGGEGRVGWCEIKVRPLAGAKGRRASLWTIADVTRERGGQETLLPGGDAAEGSRTAAATRTPVEAPAEDSADDPRAAEARFARVFNATPMAIAILDAGGRIARSNAAFARLMPEALKPSDAAAARSIYSGLLERDSNALRAALAAAASQTDIAPLDVALAGDGDRSARLFISASGEADETGATIYALDTTEQRTLQDNFAQSQKMQAIGQLAGGVAHDFNNVLTAIIGYSDLLLANHRPTDPSFRDIMQIKQNANRAAGLVRQLLAFSRRQTLRPHVLQLGDVLSDLQMMMRRLVGEKINLELRHGRDLWFVKADLNQFEQVVVNLIVNARDAMPGGGEIILRTRNVTPGECADFDDSALPPADYVAIEVEDFGHGIAPEVKDKIFEPFFTTKEVGKGTGLGLAMVYGIVKQTGGYVICSSAIGSGTTFTVLLPRHVAGAGDAPPSSAPAKAAADLTGQGTILLVEDEEAVRAFAARALASRGYSVLQAASGLEALEIVAQNHAKIDLVVSDVVMPEMDGPTMFGELRKRGVTAKVIFVSGYAEEAFAKNLPEGEEFAFLPKPFSLKQLIEAVKAAAI
ncbi:response regulator [Methylocella sp.]|jgi:two-component system cell cycle sensor histidine kinase/response regulator CckA|uniref:response regulator n=1 Tax=Methylocella sp. TaxID=1978226 RepID=UPI003C1F6965